MSLNSPKKLYSYSTHVNRLYTPALALALASWALVAYNCFVFLPGGLLGWLDGSVTWLGVGQYLPV